MRTGEQGTKPAVARHGKSLFEETLGENSPVGWNLPVAYMYYRQPPAVRALFLAEILMRFSRIT